MLKEKELKYIAYYNNNDVLNDANLYCTSLSTLYIYIETLIRHGWYKNLDEFLEDYSIFKVNYCNDKSLKRGFVQYCTDNNIKL